jgi:arginyl-tRNA synthetase
MEVPEQNETDPLAKYQDACRNAMNAAAGRLGIAKLPAMEIPPSSELGDFAYPCFALSKEMKKPPQAIAEMIKAELGELDHIDISAVNGYVNFKIEIGTLASETLPKILKSRFDYGRFPKRPEKIIVEHTSANPNGPFHVGRARNPIIGDTLTRILRRAGYEVEVQYWVNDMGKQVAILSWGVQNLPGADLPEVTSSKPDHNYVRYYQNAYQTMEDNPEVEKDIQGLIQAYERGDEDELRKVREPCEQVLNGMVESLNRINIFIDRYVWESEGVLDGTVDKIISKLKTSDISKDENGSLYLDLDHFDLGGKNSRFVYTRSDGTSLYTTRDLAYHLKKLRECDISINILGEDHKLQSKQLEIALKILKTKILPEVVFYSFVSLEEGKMSTRRGQVVYLDDLMDEAVARARKEVELRRKGLDSEQMKRMSEDVGLGAIRYNIIL